MITPMVARLVREPFDREDWLFELKWDGFRAIAEKDKQGVRLYSRNHNDFNKRFPAIAEAVKALDHVTLDGEIVAFLGSLATMPSSPRASAPANMWRPSVV